MVLNRMPLTALRGFEAAARLGAFKQAAAELGVTPATVSNQIRGLEAELGCKLFIRKTRQVVLTEAGRALSETVSTAFSAVSGELDRLRKDSSAVVEMAVGPIFATRWLMARLPRFRQDHPDIDLRVIHGPRIADAQSLTADLAIDWGYGDWPGLRAEPLLRITYAPVVSPVLLSRLGAIEGAVDLARYPIIHQKDRGEWRAWAALAGASDLAFAEEIFIEDSNVVTQAAIDGQGVALGIFPLVQDLVDTGLLVRQTDTVLEPERAYHLLTKRTTRQNRAIAAIRDWLLAQTR